MARFVFVTGGVMSSIGKGISSASIGALLQAHGFSVRIKKLDPYLNIDPGTISPYKHGEVYVMDDGCEGDLDFGHYERFTNVCCTKEDSTTTGKIYSQILTKERTGEYLGSDVQIIPHVTTEIKNFIKAGEDKVDFIICEIGGTIGDIEGLPFIEALRQMKLEFGANKTIFIHLTYLPYIKTSDELKTKPTQHSVKTMQSLGVQPDILLCRTEHAINDDIRKKISMFCNIQEQNVIQAVDAVSIYLIPEMYHESGLDKQICEHFKIAYNETNVNKALYEKWGKLKNTIVSPKQSITIAIVGKYTKAKDAYISLAQAILHAGFANSVKTNIKLVDTDNGDIIKHISDVDGIVVPGGFSTRGTEEKMEAIKFAREKNIPFLGICLGMQLAVIESCRNIANVKNATSREFEIDGEYVVDAMESWDHDGTTTYAQNQKGGTMRLGAYKCVIANNTLAHRIYNCNEINERHRHRYEINIKKYSDVFKKAGLIFSGMSEDKTLPEIVERNDCDFFIATQFHPEFKSRPFAAHPLFNALVRAALHL